jgi:hypothetical protein
VSARRAALCSALVVVVSTAGAARAAPDPTPSLVVEGCPSLDEDRLRTLVGLELATVAARARGPYDVRLTCAGERVIIEVRRRAPDASSADASATSDTASRADLDLGGAAPGTRERILALAVTEQLALEPHADEPRAPALAPPRASESATLVRSAPAAEESPARWRLDARAGARTVARPSIWLVGGGVSLERAFTRFIGGVVDLVAESGDAALPVATVTMRDLMATAGVSIGARAGRWSWDAVPGFTVGLVHLAASPRDATAVGSTLDGVWAGPSLGARGRCALSRRVFVVAAATAGLTTRRVSGLVDGQTALFEIRGPWLSLAAGVGAAF